MGNRAAHGRVRRAVWQGVIGDDLLGVFLGGFVVAEPGVAVGGVEDPLRVVEHEVILRVIGLGEPLE